MWVIITEKADLLPEKIKPAALINRFKKLKDSAIKGLFTIRFTMLGTYLAVTLVTLVLMCVYIIGILSENLYSEETTNLFAKANMIAQTAAETWNTEEKDVQYLRLEDITDRNLAGTSIRGVITNKSYTVLYDNNREANMVGKVFMRSVLKPALDGEQSTTSYESDSGKTITVGVPIERGEEIIGGVYLAENVSSISDTIETIRTSLIVFSILLLFAIGIISICLSYMVSRPFAEFTETARAISRGDFSKRVNVHGMSEIAQMGAALNYMCGELTALDEKRKNFVSDVSHELKTPMAGIKLLCDSLIEAENPGMDTVRDFLGDMSEEIDRLTRLINRLLTLTRLDAAKNVIASSVDLDSLCSGVVRGLKKFAAEKGTELVLETDEDAEHMVLADYDKIYESVYNIVDNAIKYTPDGGRVVVRVKSENKECVVEVEDNGEGIPDSEKKNVFDRFYRLDDSRARDTGGTGLGLAISKEAVQLYNGDIEIADAKEHGSIFRITLPESGGVRGDD